MSDESDSSDSDDGENTPLPKVQVDLNETNSMLNDSSTSPQPKSKIANILVPRDAAASAAPATKTNASTNNIMVNESISIAI